jgi:hypothetical protein
VATNERAITGSVNVLCATKWFITAKIIIADYQQKRDFMKKFFKTIIPIIVLVVALILFLNWANKTEKYECEIEEIQSGIYARYQSTASSTPADNYEIITVCINGQLTTYKGSVEFIFVENENKIEVTEKPNIVHSDKVIVYTSKDSVEYLGTVGIGK